MHYFIDGYNLMFRVIRAGNDLQLQREAIIRDLNRKIKRLNLHVTLIFDAQYQTGESSRHHYQHLEIRFKEHGETADDFILKEIKHQKSPQYVTVVTSDKRLAWSVRRRHAKTESVEEFLSWLNRRYKNKKKPLLELTPPTKDVKPKVDSTHPPHQLSTSEECFEYYLEQFETTFQLLATQARNAKATIKSEPSKKRRNPKPSKKISDEDGLSTTERWLKAFEREISPDDLQHLS